MDGKGTIYAGDKAFAIKKNQLFWSYPKEMHRIVSDKEEPLRFCYAGYNFLNNATLVQLHNALTSVEFPLARKVLHAPTLKHTFLNLLGEGEYEDSLSPFAIETQMKYLIFSAYRLINDRVESKYIEDKSNTSLLVYHIIKYIDDSLFDIKNLFELEAIFNYDYKYLARCFKKTVGKTLGSYFLTKKMNAAIDLLSQGCSSTQIAEKLNYSCVQSFIRAFTAYFGQSPKSKF